jgi:Tol biopolymer transport system component
LPWRIDGLIKNTRNIIALLVLMLASNSLYGQFYNGLQMTFGKNRIQYYDFYWSYYRFDEFDCYFNEYGKELAQYTSDFAAKKVAEIEDYFDYFFEKRLIFVVYNKQAEFKQSNMGLITGQEDYNVGGFSRTIKNKVMLYYEGDHRSYERQISASITEAMINEMLHDAEQKDRISGNSRVTLPDWYLKGLVNYVSFGWDDETENRVRDGIVSGRYKRLNNLEDEDAIYAGQSFWRYIAKTYGDPIIPNVIYLTKIYKNVEDGLLYVLGMKLKDLQDEWLEYYKNYYSQMDEYSEDAPISDKIITSRKKQIIQDVKISPDQRYIAYVSYNSGKRKIHLYDNTTGKIKTIFSAEPKFNQKADLTYPVIDWHPGGQILTFINEEKGDLKIYFQRIEEKKPESRNLLYFDKVLSFDYSPSGNRIVLSAVKNGVTDIYVHTIASGTNQQITNDVPDDLNPRYIGSEKNSIVFSSNRKNDTINLPFNPVEGLQQENDLFTYNLDKDNKVLTRLSEESYSNRQKPVDINSREFIYLGNPSGTINRFKAEFDSVISYIDTTTHYRYFIESRPLTNYNRNILSHDASPGSEFAEVSFSNNKYNIFTGRLDDQPPLKNENLVNSPFADERIKKLQEADSIETIRKWLIEEDRRRRDTLTKPLIEYFVTDDPIDFNHYIFEIEKVNYYEEQWKKDYMDIDLDTGSIKFPLIRIYETSFYNNYIANQVDFSFLNNSYQVYSGGAPYYNPGISMLTQIGAVDLFEDYKITGGFRFAGNFDSNEYLLSIENLKGQIDKQLVFHRQSLSSYNDTAYFKIHSNNIYLTFAKPFTPVLAVKGTVSYRNDRYVPLSTDLPTLNGEQLTRHWAGLKAELVYDNTRQRGVNIYYGTRFKVFGEYYKDIQLKKSDMFVLGVDFRHYLQIHRDLIWANRFAASSSFGPTKLLYYLGGVDNWISFLFNNDIPAFDQSIPVDQAANYGFQAIATNLRGFSQNVRNGNNFALINSEIRWPVIRYFAGHPLKSKFLNNFQLIGFGDIGTAWSGNSPWTGKNAWDIEEYENGPVKVILDSNRDPVVGGFGFGLRTLLFGYFVRADWAWGVENSIILPRVFYLSFSLDF